jgi:hypothetical protein
MLKERASRADASGQDVANYQRALETLAELRGEGGKEPSPGRIVKMSSFAAVLDVFDRVAQEHPGPWVKALREGLAALP